jgi:hypothetical protein
MFYISKPEVRMVDEEVITQWYESIVEDEALIEVYDDVEKMARFLHQNGYINLISEGLYNAFMVSNSI